MALDTRDRRASALACALAFLTVLPAPDGLALDQGDRQQVSALYRGIAAAEPVLATPDVILVQAGYGFRTLLQGADGLRVLAQGADGSTLRIEGGG